MASLETFYFILLPGNILSFVGSAFVVVLYIGIKPLRLYSFKLVAWIAFYDLVKSLCYIIPSTYFRSTGLCEAIGFLSLNSINAGILWTVTISVSLYQSLIHKIENVEKYYKCWLIFNLSYSNLTSLIPLTTQDYGLSFGLCELLDDSFGKFYIFFLGLLPQLIALIVIVSAYIRIYFKISKNIEKYEDISDINPKIFMIFPMIMIVSLLPLLVCRVLIYFVEVNQYFYMLTQVLFGLHGFFNSVAYTFLGPVSKYLKTFYRRGDSRSGIMLEVNFNK